MVLDEQKNFGLYNKIRDLTGLLDLEDEGTMLLNAGNHSPVKE
jgi:hypothetical protein